MSGSQDTKRTDFYAKRREQDPGFFQSESWLKRSLKKLERLNKRLTLSLFSQLLGIKQVKSPVPLDQVKSVLILRYDALGDMIVTTEIWRILKAQAPHIRIGVAGSYRNLDLLRADTDVDVTYDMSETDSKQMLKAARQARKDNWQIVLHTVYNKRTKGAIFSRLAAPKGITTVAVEKDLERYKKLFSIVGYLPNVDNRPAQTLDLLKTHFTAVFDYLPSEDEWHPSVRIDSKAIDTVRQRIEELHSGHGTSKIILIHTEAWTPFKEWGYENILALTSELSDFYTDTLFLLTASPSTRVKLEDHLAGHSHNENLVYFPTSDLHEMMAVVRMANLVVTPDTSVVHLATAERKPIVATYVFMSEWLPYHVPNIVLIPKEGQPVSTIPVQDVLQAVKELLTA